MSRSVKLPEYLYAWSLVVVYICMTLYTYEYSYVFVCVRMCGFMRIRFMKVVMSTRICSINFLNF